MPFQPAFCILLLPNQNFICFQHSRIISSIFKTTSMAVLSKDSGPILVMYEKSTIHRPKLIIRPYIRQPRFRAIFYLLSVLFMISTSYIICKILTFQGWSESQGWGMHMGWMIVYECIFTISMVGGQDTPLGKRDIVCVDIKSDYNLVYAENLQRLQRTFDNRFRDSWMSIIADLPGSYGTAEQRETWRKQRKLDLKIEFAALLGGTWRKQGLTSTFSFIPWVFWPLVGIWVSFLLLMFGFGVLAEYESCRGFEYIYGTWLFLSIRAAVLFLWSVLVFQFSRHRGWKGGIADEAWEIRQLCIEQSRRHGRDGKKLLCNWIQDFLVPADSDVGFKWEMEKVVGPILKDVYWVEVRPWVDHGGFLPRRLHDYHCLTKKILSSTSDSRERPRRRTYSSVW